MQAQVAARALQYSSGAIGRTSTSFVRRRLDRWRIGALPGHRPQRALRVFQVLTGKVPPRVLAALLGTLFNGWCTGRRFQQQGSSCISGCAAEDSPELSKKDNKFTLEKLLARQFVVHYCELRYDVEDLRAKT